MNAATIDTGIVTAGISVARRLPRNEIDHEQHRRERDRRPRSDTSLHRRLDRDRVVDVDLEPRARRQRRLDALHLGAHAACHLERVAPSTAPRPDAEYPARRWCAIGALVLAPRAARRRPRRAGRGARPCRGAITSLRKSCSVSRPIIVRSENSRVRDSSRPAGSSTFSRRSALSMSVTVSWRAASAWRSIQTRIAYRRAPLIVTRATPGHRRQPIDEVALRVVRELEHRHRVGAESRAK